MSPSSTLAPGTGIVHLPVRFDLHLGGTLEGAQVAYELTGPEDGPLVVALGGISAGRHVCANEPDPAPGWWEELVGPGCALDTTRFRVLAIDWLGGGGCSTGPRAGAPFPLVTSHDQARAIACVLDELGTPRVARFVGSSFGGMVALAFASLFPARVTALTVIGAAHESHPLASAWRSLQRKIVRLGLAHGAAAAAEALALARGLAMTSYRTPGELAERFSAPPSIGGAGAEFPIDSWLEARGRDFVRRFTPEVFLSLCWAIDLHRVEPETITAPVTLVAATTDQIVPLVQVQDLARRLAGPSRLVTLETGFGHDAFLKEPEAIGAVLRRDVAEVAS